MDLQFQAPVFDVAGLPPLPADPRAGEVARQGKPPRHVSWVVCCQAPGFHYKEHYIDVTPEWIDGRIEAYTSHVESKPGWLPPVQVGHTDTGQRRGDFFELRRVTLGAVVARSAEHPDGLDWSDPRETMLGAVAWTDPDAARQIENNELTHVSIGIKAGIQRPDNGEWLHGVPDELTQTAGPHLGAPILCGAVMPEQVVPPEADKKKKDDEEEVEAMEEIAPPMDPMAMMMEMMKEILSVLKPAPAPVAEAVTPTPLEAKIVSLEAMLVAEQEARTAAEKNARRVAFDARCPAGGSLSLTANIADLVFEATEANPDAATSIMEAYTGAKTAAPQVEIKATPPPIVARANPWQERLATSTANAPDVEANTVSLEAIRATTVKDDGTVDEAKALTEYEKHRLAGRIPQEG